MARLFLALWPGSATRAALSGLAGAAAERFGGRAVPAANLHLTLVFLGELDESRIGALEAAAGAVRGKAFTMALDRIGGFGRAGVAWAGCSRVPPEMLSLQAGLEARVREAGFQPDDRAFSPHLTLARKVREPVAPSPVPAVDWRVRDFALVESVRPAGAYRVLARWPLVPEKT